MRHIYPQCHFVKEQHERRDAATNDNLLLLSMEAILRRRCGNGLHGNRQLQLGFKCPYGYQRSENDVMGNQRDVKIMSRSVISRIFKQKGCEFYMRDPTSKIKSCEIFSKNRSLRKSDHSQLRYFQTYVNPKWFPTRLLQDSKSSFSPFFGLDPRESSIYEVCKGEKGVKKFVML